MEPNYKAIFEYHIAAPYKVEAFYPINNNACCEKTFFMLTTNLRADGSTNYSCQCGCGMWCTNGHNTAQEAIDEYRTMCARYKKEVKR